jgi:hypothetical protein
MSLDAMFKTIFDAFEAAVCDGCYDDGFADGRMKAEKELGKPIERPYWLS